MPRLTVAGEGLPFILPPLILTLGCVIAGWYAAALPLAVLTLFLIWFFRKPMRPIPTDSSHILAPADGRILGVREVDEPFARRIDIFMSVFNVHVNRAPASGMIKKVAYRRGRKVPADTEEASLNNEHNYVEMDSPGGLLAFKQIAGILARRVVFYPQAGERVEQGDPVGIIKFGSRVEVFLPGNTEILVQKGERVIAGQTVLARWT